MRIRSIFISILMAVGFVLAVTPPASAATPTPTTQVNARTIKSCTVTTTRLTGSVALKGTTAADLFWGWNGTRIVTSYNSAASPVSSSKVDRITINWRRAGGYPVVVTPYGSLSGINLFAGKQPRPGDTLTVTYHWASKYAGVPTGGYSCTTTQTLPAALSTIV